MNELNTTVEPDEPEPPLLTPSPPDDPSQDWMIGEEGEGLELATGPGLIGTLIPAAVVTAILGWSFKSELSWCWETWSADPNYSHGFLVIPVSLWIFWRRLREPVPRLSQPWQLGWILLLVLLGARTFFYERGFQWTAAASLPLVLACLALTLGGWTFLQRSWPALVFLFFMLPLPTRVNGLLAQPLQGLATSASVTLLKISGLWVLAEGNVIYVGKQPIMVAEACNGLSMMMTLAATVAAAVFILPVPAWIRVVLGLSVAPIALIANILRITATAWSVQWFGPEIGGSRAHDAAGWLMMPLALVLVFVEMMLLRRLVVEEVHRSEPMLLGRPIAVSQGPRQRLEAPKRSTDEASKPLEGDISESPSSEAHPKTGQGRDE